MGPVGGVGIAMSLEMLPSLVGFEADGTLMRTDG
jgi:hypothetical protein